MPGSRRSIRRPLFALAAIVAASFAAGEASACEAMKRGPDACAAACGCCDDGSVRREATPISGPSAASEAGRPDRLANPAGDCSCRSETPAAPAPRPARGASEVRPDPRPEPASPLAFGPARPTLSLIAPQVPATQSPPKAPLYLRNARLLF